MSTLYPDGGAAPVPSYPGGADPRGRHRGSAPTWRRGGLRVALAVLTVASLGLLVGAGYAWYTYRDINNGVTRLGVAVGAPPSGKKDIDGQDQNILLVGNDDRTELTPEQQAQLKVGSDGGSMSTDSMMIVHVPANGSRATLISLPRDSYVAIPGNGMNKLNAAYVLGYTAASGTADQRRTAGADLMIRTIENLTGLTINHYVQVSLMGFYDISNAIGGVTVDLCNAVDDSYSGFQMSAGVHTIQGLQALEFVRQRHGLPNGDLDRVRRQQYFLTAAFRKVASVGIVFKLQSLGDAVKRNLYLDPGMDLLSLANQLSNLSANNIISRTIPFEGFDDNSPVGSVEIVDPAKVQAFIDQLINPPKATVAPTASGAASSGATTSPSPSASPSASSTAPIDSACVN